MERVGKEKGLERVEKGRGECRERERIGKSGKEKGLETVGKEKGSEKTETGEGLETLQ